MNINNFSPDKIIVYRDGISEGQYETALRVEYSEIKKVGPSCTELSNQVCLCFFSLDTFHRILQVLYSLKQNTYIRHANVHMLGCLACILYPF
jgi:hypothetical protein